MCSPVEAGADCRRGVLAARYGHHLPKLGVAHGGQLRGDEPALTYGPRRRDQYESTAGPHRPRAVLLGQHMGPWRCAP